MARTPTREPNAVWITQADAASRLNTTTPRLIGLRRRGRFPPGVYDAETSRYHWKRLEECWALVTTPANRTASVKTSGGEEGSTEDLQRRRAEADADTAMLRNQKEAGRLVDVGHAGSCAAVVVGRVRQLIQKMPDDRARFIATELDVPMESVREALRQVSADMVVELQGIDIEAILKEEASGEEE